MNTNNKARMIFLEAIEQHAPEKRAEFIAIASDGDVDLQMHVERLLHSQQILGSFHENGLPVDVTFDQSATEKIGTQIGPYKLLEQLGEGGMGTVYVAEQREPVRRKVALKLIKPGMDSQQVVARFEAERQALAMMNHPNIAKVLDAGTTTAGRPFFAMELVKGTPITQFCDQQKLDTRQRLQLFITVCQAVQHAHQKGLIHRDLKPSNVLVEIHDVKPVPKVIDFGVAKAIGQQLTEKTLHTGTSQMIGTPLYMSPEQAGLSSIDVDTRSDIYSLGVLLYEILTGHTPFESETLRKAGFDEMRRLICEVDPPRPSARISTLEAQALSTVSDFRKAEPHKLSQQLRGELDWIVMKALEKDRNRRYESASALAADVQCYLDDRPVEACPPSAGYRFSKFARKNRVILTTVAIVATTMLIGSGVSAWQAVRATNAEKRTDRQRKLAEDSASEAKRQTSEALLAQSDAQLARQEAERQRKAVSQNLYRADMRLGHVDWKAGNIGRLSTKLLEHVPKPGTDDQRGWEWYYLLSLCHQDDRTLMHHTDRLTSVSWSPDGSHLATTSYGGELNIYDTSGWRVLRTRAGFSPQGVSWSPDSLHIAWGETPPKGSSRNGPIIMDIRTGETKTFLGHSQYVYSTAWSSDGKHLASGGVNSEVRIWDLTSGLCVQVMAAGVVRCVAWHPEGKLLASVSYDRLKIWDALSGNMLHSVSSTNGMNYAAWSPNGKELALAKHRECVVYRTADWSVVSQWTAHVGNLNSLAWNPDGNTLVSVGSDNLIQLWDSADGTCTLTLRGHLNQVQSVAWEPNGQRIVSGGGDGLIKVWSLSPAPLPLRINGSAGLTIAWYEDSNTLRSYAAADGTVTLWNVVNGERLGELEVPGSKTGCLSSTGKFLAIDTSPEKPLQVGIHDASTGELVKVVKKGIVSAVRFSLSPDASKLAVTDRQALEILDLHQNEVLFRGGNIRMINALSWSPDGKRLAAAGAGDQKDRSSYYTSWVYVFDTEKIEPVISLRHGESRVQASAVSWSPDGRRLVSGDQNGQVEVWEVPIGKKVTSVQMHSSSITAFAWSPDGRRIASGGKDTTLHVWDPTCGEELLKLEVPEGSVKQIEWSPDGKRLAAATDVGAIFIWDVSSAFSFLQSENYVVDQVRNQLKQANQFWNEGRKDEAFVMYEQTVKESKTKLGSITPWATAKTWRGGWHARSVGEDEKSFKLFQVSVLLSSDHAPWLNDFAWLLATVPDPNLRDPTQAVELAKKALQLNPSDEYIYNTLGVAQYYAGDWFGCLAALKKSVELREGGESVDWFFLAMAHWLLNHRDEARVCYDKAVEWMDKHQPQDEELMRFRAEADELLGIYKVSEPNDAKQPASVTKQQAIGTD